MELTRLGLLLAKIETTYGVDPTPSASTDVIAARRGTVRIEPVSTAQDRDWMTYSHSRLKGWNLMPYWKISFATEVRGNRTDGVANDISKGSSSNPIIEDRLLRACDLTPTYTAETSANARDGYVTYNPRVPTYTAVQGDSVTLYFYSQGKLYKFTGCKGNMESISVRAGQPGVIEWNFFGKYNATVDSTIPAPTFANLPLPPIASSSSQFDIGGYTNKCFNEMTVRLGNNIVPREDLNSINNVLSFMNTDRKSSGTILMDSFKEAEVPFWADWKARSNMAFTGKILGGGTGNFFEMGGRLCSDVLAYEDQNGLRKMRLNFSVVADTLTGTTDGNELYFKWS